MLAFSPAFSQTNVSGGIYNSTTWTLANSPYIITDTTTVFPGVTLTIEPGVTVKFYDYAPLNIRGGTILAIGTPSDSIKFTAFSSFPSKESWKGIYMNSDATIKSRFCKFNYATSAVCFVNLSLDVSISFDHCTFEHNKYGISRSGSGNSVSGTVDSCYFANNDYGIDMMGYGTQFITNSIFTSNKTGVGGAANTTMIINCNICNNTVAGIFMARAIINCNIQNNNIGVLRPNDSLINCIIANNNIGVEIQNMLSTHIYGNSICNNTTYDLVNNSANNLLLKDNCWCETDSASIALKIYDGYDNISRGLITFWPYKNCGSSAIPDDFDCNIILGGMERSTYSSQTINVCDAYSWNNTTYTNSGTYRDTIPNAAGFDSIMTLHLTVRHSSTYTQNVSACHSYQWHGNTYTTSGTYLKTIPNASGCDSIIWLNLTISQSSSSVQNITACNSYLWNGNTYTFPGTYFDTIPNANSCDSIMTLHLTVNHSSSSAQNINACQSYHWNGNTYYNSGTYLDTIPNAFSCDSILTLVLLINKVDITVSVTNNVLTSNESGAVYQWLDCNNNFAGITGAGNQTYSPPASGSYAVKVTKNGCTDSSACHTITMTGVFENNIANKFSVYPNPVSGIFIIDYPTGKDELYEITDITGKTLRKGMITEKQTSVDFSEAESGIYFLKISGQTMKLVKQ
jgi:hypothetical protein